MNDSTNTILMVALVGVVLFVVLKPKPAPVNPLVAAGGALGSLLGGVIASW